METGTVPVLWITGAPAAGKSASAWAVFRRLAERGSRAAYLDIDQVGMLYPTPPDDPEAHRLKAQALRALLPGYAEHGAEVLVVSGVVDTRRGPRPELPEDVGLTLVALATADTTLDERLRDRGWSEDDIDEARLDNRELRDAQFLDAWIETARLGIDAVADRIMEQVTTGTASDRTRPRRVVSDAPMPVVVITGPRAVGTSTVGFGLAARRWAAESSTAYVDTAQLSFLDDGADLPPDGLAARQLAAMHSFFTVAGASMLVVGGGASTPADWAPRAPRLLVRLRADRQTFEAHVRERSIGSAARLAGDDLVGADADHLAEIVRCATSHQDRLDRHAPTHELTLDVSGRSPGQVIDDVERLVARAGW